MHSPTQTPTARDGLPYSGLRPVRKLNASFVILQLLCRHPTGVVSCDPMRKTLVLLAVLALCAGGQAATQSDSGTPAAGGVVVCTSAPSCDVGAATLAQ